MGYDKHIFVFLFGILVVFQSQASPDKNQAKIDSLENKLYNSLSFGLSSEDKISICIELSHLYSATSSQKRVEFASRALILAEEKGDSENLIKSLELLSEAYINLNQNEKSIEYLTRLYNIHQTNNKEIEAGKALNRIAFCYYSRNKYVEAMDYYTRALNIFKKHQYFEGIAATSHDLAIILGHWGEYDEALNKSQEALKFWEEIGDKKGTAKAYCGIGRFYQELENYESAFEFYRKSLDIYEELNDNSEIVSLTLNIGDIYLMNQLFDKALEYYFRAELIGKNLNSNTLTATTLGHIGQAYNLKGEYLKALDYQQKSLKLKREIGDKMQLSESYIELGIIYYNVEDFKKALTNLNLGLELAYEINFKYQIINGNKHLSDVYTKLGQFDKALSTYQQYIKEKEAIFSEENKQTIAELRAKYEIEKKEKENERLRHSQQLNNAQIRNQQLIIGFVLFILLGSFVLSIIFHGRYQLNQKLNIELSLKNKKIEDQQNNVEKLNIDLKEANRTKDKFFSIVAHDLKSPFNSLLILTKLLLDDYDTFSNEERRKFISQIKSSAENTYSLLENLLQWASAQSNKTIIVKENIALSKLTDETITLLTPIAKHKKINLSSSIDNSLIGFADKNMISTVLLNMVSNAVKFTPHQGRVEISGYEKNNHIEVVISDSGVGISDKNMKKLFKPGEKFQTVGTDREKGTGLGLILCKEFVEKNDGKIWVDSEEGKGSRFYFSLPKSS